MKKKVCGVGLGYIGLPTAIVAANADFDVVGFDIDQKKVERINNFDPVIEEPELSEKLREALSSGNFRAIQAIEAADFFVIAVPTPFLENKEADLSYIWHAAASIATVLKKGDVVILESTVPVRATDKLGERLEMLTPLKAGVDFFVAHCPERVLPGKIFHELVHNARIIGGINQESVEQAKLFYKAFVKGALYLTNATTAEMVKLVENSSRDVEIAFANQVAAMAYKIGLNPFEVIELANKHPRVNILNPSCGVGGHCIAVDPWFLVQTFPEETKLLKMARDVNSAKPRQVVQATRYCIERWRQAHQKVANVLILGLTYKPDIDDLRESPALEIAKKLSIFTDMNLLICDPYIHNENIVEIFGHDGVSLQKGIEQADIILCLVKHTAFKKIDALDIQHKKILDFCGIFYEPHKEQDTQEKLFWPASNAAIRSIIDHMQGEI
ncbi:MAG: nucleotide sugar dehydrogenase [Candidatus Babeliales bacterium]